MNNMKAMETTGGVILAPVLENILLLQFSQHRRELTTNEVMVHLKTGYFFVLRGDAAKDFLGQVGLEEYKDRIIKPVPLTMPPLDLHEEFTQQKQKSIPIENIPKKLTFFQSLLGRWIRRHGS